MVLQILVPQYKETEEVIKPLLDSIAIQQNINFDDIGVIICNDGSDVLLSNEFFNNYPFCIEYILSSHKGVSATRNICFDNAIADYVMFCDADDMFYSVCGISTIFGEIDKGFDCMISSFIEEGRLPEFDTPTYIENKHDGTFVHGKIYRRQYLLDNNIRWKEELIRNEDSYFNILSINLTDNVVYCEIPFYFWRYREDSVTRKDLKFKLKYFNDLIKSSDMLVQEFLKRGRTDKAIFYVGDMIFYTYYNLNKAEWILQENKQYKESTENRIAEYYKKYKYLWDSLDMQNKLQLSNNVRNDMIKDIDMLMESITLDDWLQRIEKQF